MLRVLKVLLPLALELPSDEMVADTLYKMLDLPYVWLPHKKHCALFLLTTVPLVMRGSAPPPSAVVGHVLVHLLILMYRGLPMPIGHMSVLRALRPMLLRLGIHFALGAKMAL